MSEYNIKDSITNAGYDFNEGDTFTSQRQKEGWEITSIENAEVTFINMGQAGLHNFVFTNEGVDGENLERQVFDFVASLSKFESYVDLGDNLDRAAQQ